MSAFINTSDLSNEELILEMKALELLYKKAMDNEKVSDEVKKELTEYGLKLEEEYRKRF